MAIISVPTFCYAATQSGLAFASYAVEASHRCLVGEPSEHKGGLSTSGLVVGDWSTPRWGKTKQVNQYAAANPPFNFTDGREVKNVGANQMWAAMQAVYLASGLIEIKTNVKIKRVLKLPGSAPGTFRITGVETLAGDLIIADHYHDASYGGDLARAAGVRMRSNREGAQQFGGPVQSPDAAGLLSTPGFNPTRHNPETGGLFDSRGDRFWFASQAPQRGIEIGSALANTQANGWRFELMFNANGEDIGLPWVKPSDWTQADDRRILDLMYRSQGGNGSGSSSGNLFPFGGSAGVINDTVAGQTGRYGTNGCDLPGMHTNPWFEASYAERDRIEEHAAWITMGSHWVTANHPEVSTGRRNAMRRYRMPSDTHQSVYRLFQGWPPLLYIRDGGSAWAQYMMTGKHLINNPATGGGWNFDDSVSTGGYHPDIHTPMYYCRPDGYGQKEGSVSFTTGPNYGIPLRAGLPHAGQAENLTFSWIAGGDALWRSSFRMEQTVACFAQALGMLVAIALRTGRTYAQIPFAELKTRLIAESAVTTV